MHRKLPIRILLLLGLVFGTTCWQVIRFITSIAWRVTLETYEPYPGPIYIGITGTFWALTGLFLLWSTWRGRRWTRMSFVLASSLYAAWVWADRLFVQNQIRANWPFDLVLTIVLLVFTIIVVLDPRNKIYFERETYERES
jgi:hypothetical protein